MATELTCPKCQATMRNYERNGIQIDQCTECRGIYLDRGELELLMDAEAAYSRPTPNNPAGPVPGPLQQPTPPAGQGWDQAGGHHGKSGYGGQGKRKKSFLSELFD